MTTFESKYQELIDNLYFAFEKKMIDFDLPLDNLTDIMIHEIREEHKLSIKQIFENYYTLEMISWLLEEEYIDDVIRFLNELWEIKYTDFLYFLEQNIFSRKTIHNQPVISRNLKYKSYDSNKN